MKPGEIAEIAIWLTGTETEEDIQRFMTVDALRMLDEAADEHNVMIGPMAFFIKRPGEERVPQVPDHISGPDVRLLVGEARIYKRDYRPSKASTFILDLEPEDLRRLREATQRSFMRAAPPGTKPLSINELDQIISEMGPEIAAQMVRNTYDNSTVN